MHKTSVSQSWGFTLMVSTYFGIGQLGDLENCGSCSIAFITGGLHTTVHFVQ